jgi:hypothetical protein
MTLPCRGLDHSSRLATAAAQIGANILIVIPIILGPAKRSLSLNATCEARVALLNKIRPELPQCQTFISCRIARVRIAAFALLIRLIRGLGDPGWRLAVLGLAQGKIGDQIQNVAEGAIPPGRSGLCRSHTTTCKRPAEQQR